VVVRVGEDPVRYVPTSGETEDGRDEVKGAVASEADLNELENAESANR